MKESHQPLSGMTRYRWVICSMLFLATTINYLDRQVLSLTWKDFIAPEFGWNDTDYGVITGCFFYCICGEYAPDRKVYRSGRRTPRLSLGYWCLVFGSLFAGVLWYCHHGLLSGSWILISAGRVKVWLPYRRLVMPCRQ